MANIIQRRRGTTLQHASFTGSEGEITIDLDKETVVCHDGSTAGGFPLAREDLSNVANKVGISQLNLSDGSAGQVLSTNGSGTISFVSIGAASVGGDLSGTIANAQIGANKVGITELAFADGTNGQYLTTNGSGTLSFATINLDVAVGGDLSGTVSNAQIGANKITATELADNAVTTSHILNANVTEAKLATDAVVTASIKDANVTDQKILSLTSNKLTGQLPALNGSSLTNINPNSHVHPAVQKPYDVSFIAGWDAETVQDDVKVQTYAVMVMARSGVFEGEVGFIETACTGATLICDVEKNGSSIYSTKPTFAISSATMTAGAFSTTTFASGDRVTFKVTQVGSTVKGKGVRFMLKCKV